MKYDRSEKKIDFSFISIRRIFLLLLVTLLCYSCAFFVPIVFLLQVIKILNFRYFTHIFLFSVSVVFSYLLLVFSLMISSAFFIRIFRVRYEEGEYQSTIKDKISTKFILSYALYFPTYKIIDFLNLPPVKSLFLKMIGCKIGKNVVLGGGEWIFDPYVIEIGDNTTIGGRCLLTAHLGEGGRLIIKKITIGKNCLIGGDCFIMPGVIVEDNVVVGAKSLVLKDQVLNTGKVYAGVPVHEISTSEQGN
ncbi:MAG: acyltransferase [Candidatus Thermoplasmatota archaeon]|nr:acyltransferase [Candidatus Thermoplasmatota archaeon]